MLTRPDPLTMGYTTPVDLSTNVPYHAGLRKQLRGVLGKVDPFKYPAVGALYHDLAAHYGVDADTLTLGHGATEIIERIVRALRDHIWYIVSPTFEMVEVYCQMHGVEYVKVRSSEEVVPDTPDTVLYVASPNGLTGALHDGHNPCKYMVFDNVYGEYTTPRLPQSTNEIVVRSFSKSLGLAGIRCGWCIASPEITHHLQQIRSNHPINGTALDVVGAALGKVESVNHDWQLSKGYLATLYDMVPTEAAFVLFKDTNKHTEMFGCKRTPQGLYRMALADMETLHV